MEIGWSRSNRCEVCFKRPNHRVRKKEPGEVWRYICNPCWPQWKERYLEVLTRPKVMYVD